MSALASAPDTTISPDAERALLERVLGSRYRFVRLIGRGGMGGVYLAREIELERLVAIKVLPNDGERCAVRRERFRREARTNARLSHPNIVPLHSYGEVNGVAYLAMEFVRGESLAARLERDGRLPVAEACRILSDLASALDYAHREGVVHRDIKPDNILLERETGNAVLTDFGVATLRTSDQVFADGEPGCGTPHYMSPEQVGDESAIDGRSDIYSLGVLAYAMLSGRLPFDGASFRDIALQHLAKSATPLALVAPHVPAAIARVIEQCLSKDPGARFRTARLFRDALSEAVTRAQREPAIARWMRSLVALFSPRPRLARVEPAPTPPEGRPRLSERSHANLRLVDTRMASAR